jgi:hypothetical protein
VDAGSAPSHLDKESFVVSAGDAFKIGMERGGGFVMILDPVKAAMD